MSEATSSPAGSRERDVALWGWCLATLRLALILAALLICAPLYYLLAPFTKHNPAPRLFLRVVTTIAGVRLRIAGTRAASRIFFLANHVSWLDIPAMAAATGSAFVAHDGLAAIGPLRWLCRLNDTVFVARHDRLSVASQVEQIRAALRETGALTIFPEGTTSDGNALLPFKSSLLSALDAETDHIPVQPVWLDYGSATHEIAWVGDEPGLNNALRILARWRPIYLVVNLLPPLTESGRADRKIMARAGREAIAKAMTHSGT